MKLFLITLFICGCSGLRQGTPKEGKTSYSYLDASGTFRHVRETKIINRKLVTRSQLIDGKGGRNRVLEKSILVSQIGSIKAGKRRLLTIRPQASDFTVWLDGKKYSSKMRIDSANRSMRVTLESPEEKWQGKSSIPFPKAKYFCFFSQIPECLYHNHLLSLSRDQDPKKIDFFIVWEGYPFIQDLLTRVGRNLFAPASLKFDGEFNGLFRYIVEVEGQTIFYQFTKSFDLVKVAWIAQGVTIAPPGESIVDDE